MKDNENKEINKSELNKKVPEITMDQLRGSEPYVFEQDRELVEDLASKNRYIRALFSVVL